MATCDSRESIASALTARSGDDNWLVGLVQSFRADDRTPRKARKKTCEYLAHHADQDTIDVAELLVSELTTNAVLASAEIAHALVTLSLRIIDGELLIRVLDRAPGKPQAISVTPGDERGRGMSIVRSLSTRCGFYLMGGGWKCVYCTLRIKTAES